MQVLNAIHAPRNSSSNNGNACGASLQVAILVRAHGRVKMMFLDPAQFIDWTFSRASP